MTQKEFNDTIKKYLEGNCTQEEEREIEEWYATHKFESLNMGSEEMTSIEKRIWSGIVQKTTLKKRFRVLKQIGVFAAAACVILVAGFFFKPRHQPPSETGNGISEKRHLTLPDGSEVTLEKNAQIHFDKNFNTVHRNVTLDGSAFFQVTPDKTRPFIISSGDLVTEVLGTSFEISQNPDRDVIEVRVVTGEVTVYNPSMKKQTKVILTPNQKVVYNKLFKNLNRTLVESPQPLTEKVSAESKFIFVNTPLREVAQTFREVYGIDFQIYDKNIEECIVNADLENLPMFTRLDLICRSVDASYIINGTTVFLSGEGCN